MLTIKEYVRPETLEEAYTLYQKKSNLIIGGMLWLKMQDRSIHTAIDLQDLHLDTIKETETEYRIGCMVSLRDLELHKGLNDLTQGALADSVRHIVGVQFRNLATIGGSIWGRFGFSDVLTLFMAVGAKVHLYQGGIMTLAEFAKLPRTVRDLLICITIPKTAGRTVYLSQRNSATDFPVLTCAVSKKNGILCCAVGARPGKAILLQDLPQDPCAAADTVSSQLNFGSNLRAGSQYRQKICRVLVRRAIEQMEV